MSLGIVTAAGWLLVVILLVRMATNGSFVEVTLQWDPRSRALVSAGCVALIALAFLLALRVATHPDARNLLISACCGLIIVPFALPLLAINHESAVLVPPLGLVIAAVSLIARRGIRPPASDTRTPRRSPTGRRTPGRAGGAAPRTSPG